MSEWLAFGWSFQLFLMNLTHNKASYKQTVIFGWEGCYLPYLGSMQSGLDQTIVIGGTVTRKRVRITSTL